MPLECAERKYRARQADLGGKPGEKGVEKNLATANEHHETDKSGGPDMVCLRRRRAWSIAGIGHPIHDTPSEAELAVRLPDGWSFSLVT